MTNAIEKAKILLVEDSPSLAEIYKGYLRKENHNVTSVGTGAEGIDYLKAELFDLVLLDLRLPDMDGMDVLRWVHESDIHSEIVIITAHGSIDAAIEALRYGAADFITKPFDATRLRVTVDNVLDKYRLSNIVSQYQQTIKRERFHHFIGASLPMQTIYKIIENAAPSKATIFISGASGTGKELCANAIHKESPRNQGDFVAINCAAIPRDLIETEIFGHAKGAFTGATARRDGAATRAHKGTLFLDEICEMDLDLQSKLLRFIQTGRFLRVGDSVEEVVDIRIVCATNRSPIEEVRKGNFREDLYYRLNVIPIELPSLTEREDDVLLIAGEILRRFAGEESKSFTGLTPQVAKAFLDYSWPGNIRELENVLRNIIVLNDAKEVEFDMLPQALQNTTPPPERTAPNIVSLHALPRPQADTTILPLWQEEKRIIESAIAKCDENIAKAASLLGISPSTIYRKRMSWEKLEQEYDSRLS